MPKSDKTGLFDKRREVIGHKKVCGLFNKRKEELEHMDACGYEYTRDFSYTERCSHISELEYWENEIRKELGKCLGLADLKRRLYGD